MTREHWIPAPGFPGYQVSTRGRVRNASTGRVLHHATKLYPSTRYPAANLPSGGKFRSVRTHVLVCEAFWGPRPAGHEAAHVNGDRSDTRPTNLEWQTVSRNRRDAAAAQRAELGRVRRGWSKRRRRRRPINADLVRLLLAAGVTGAAISRVLGCSPSTVSRIGSGSRRANL